jgi:hypothetical protein
MAKQVYHLHKSCRGREFPAQHGSIQAAYFKPVTDMIALGWSSRQHPVPERFRGPYCIILPNYA